MLLTSKKIEKKQTTPLEYQNNTCTYNTKRFRYLPKVSSLHRGLGPFHQENRPNLRSIRNTLIFFSHWESSGRDTLLRIMLQRRLHCYKSSSFFRRNIFPKFVDFCLKSVYCHVFDSQPCITFFQFYVNTFCFGGFDCIF